MLSVAHDHFGGMHTAIERCATAGRVRVAVVLTMSANEIVRDKWLAAHALYTGPGEPSRACRFGMRPLSHEAGGLAGQTPARCDRGHFDGPSVPG